MTWKALVRGTASDPVVTVTLRGPSVVVGCTVMLAWIEVALDAVTVPTVMPVPKLTVLQLGEQPAAVLKSVNFPVSVTVSVWP